MNVSRAASECPWNKSALPFPSVLCWGRACVEDFHSFSLSLRSTMAHHWLLFCQKCVVPVQLFLTGEKTQPMFVFPLKICDPVLFFVRLALYKSERFIIFVDNNSLRLPLCERTSLSLLWMCLAHYPHLPWDPRTFVPVRRMVSPCSVFLKHLRYLSLCGIAWLYSIFDAHFVKCLRYIKTSYERP